MGRRLIIILTVALTVAGSGVRRARAEPEPEAPPPAAPAPAPLPAPAEPEPAKGADLPPPVEPAKEAERETIPPATGQELPAPRESPAPAEPGPTGKAAEPTPTPPPAPPAPAESPAAPMELPITMPKARLLGAEPVEALPPAAAMPPPAPAPIDPAVKPSQAPGAVPKQGAETNPLPPAVGTGAGPAGAAREADPEPFLLAPDQLQPGRQAIGLTVDVLAPPTININQTATLKIVVKNTGASDVRGVVVRDELPENLAFESSQPEAQRAGTILFWNLHNVPGGSERTILLKVKPTRVGTFDHAATVTMRAGGKSQTIVREPKLKVEQRSTMGKVLRGEQVKFTISIANPGDGPARDVVIQAKLSPGLRHEADASEPTADRSQLFEQTIDVIGPGQRVVLDPLVADTVLGGPQSCLVVVQSPDVVNGSDDAKSLATVTVIEPKLRVALGGPKSRYTNTLATYTITVENPGTSTARNVKVSATLPVSGQLASVPPGARWNKSTGQLLWMIPQVEPGEKEKQTLSFQVKMGGIGFYQVAVESRAEGCPYEKATIGTDVTGLADVVFDVTEDRRTVDVGDETSFKIRIKNVGTKEATRLLVHAKFSTNLDVISTLGHDGDARQLSKEQPDTIVFPMFSRLAPGKEIVLGIKVRAKSPGMATCRAYVMHDDMKDPLDDVAYTRITTINRQ